MSLDNLELTCKSDESACTAAIDNAVAHVKQHMGDNHDLVHAVTGDKLVITIKPKQWFADANAMLRSKVPEKYEDNKPSAEPAAGDLVGVSTRSSQGHRDGDGWGSSTMPSWCRRPPSSMRIET